MRVRHDTAWLRGIACRVYRAVARNLAHPCCYHKQSEMDPTPIAIGEVTSAHIATGLELSARLRDSHGELPERLWFHVDGAPTDRLPADADAFAAALALPAMAAGRPLQVDGPVSAALLEGLGRIMRQHAAWSQGMAVPLAPVEIRARPAHRAARGSRAVSFFSGGLDSFYTLLRNHGRYPEGDARRIDAIVLLHGFDVPLTDEETFARVREHATAVTKAVGCELFVIRTNVREVLPRLDWETQGHGAALAAAGLALSSLVHTVFVPSSGQPLSAGLPNAVHASLVPWWSTETTEFVSDGSWATRSAKTALVARSPVAREHLRVCWQANSRGRNCGDCEKCLRTMIDLHIAGVLDQCALFPPAVDIERVRRLSIPLVDYYFWREMLELLLASGDTDLANAVRTALVREEWSRSGAALADRVVNALLAPLGLSGARLKELDRRWLHGYGHRLMEASRRRAWRRHRKRSSKDRKR
jgi:hypothetical protein